MFSGGDLSKVTHYPKPSSRPEPLILPQPTVEEVKADSNSIGLKKYHLTEMVYSIVRSFNGTAESVPPWGPFHVILHQDSVPISVIAYNPILMAPPTDYSTIFTTLLRNKDIIRNLGYKHLPIIFDMGLLTKALEITWSQPDLLAGVHPCEGGMHLLMAVMAAIGHLYGDAGLFHLLHDSGSFGPGAAQEILSGRDFDRGLYAMKLVDEVLHSLFLQEFETWCNDKEITLPVQVTNLKDELQLELGLPLPDPNKVEKLVDEMCEVVDYHLLPILEAFRAEGKAASATFALWDSFLQRVSLPLKMFLAATRKGNWKVYQNTKAQFLPLLFAANRTNYARYMPVLLLLMKRLPSEVAEEFQQSAFVANLSEGQFNSVWIDYAIEATENKTLKGSGGIIGLTLRGPALARWFLARPVTARYSAEFSDSICKTAKDDTKKSQHHGTRTCEVKRWNKNVSQMKAMFEAGTFINPFNIPEHPIGLVNFATGVIATSDIQKSLLGALDTGEVLAESFVQERLVAKENNTPSKSFYAPMKRTTIKTMSSMAKSVKVKSKNVSVPGEVMYLRLLAINNKKQVPLERVMAFENASVPLSMFTDEGLMISGKKSVFLEKLESLIEAEPIHVISNADAIVFDANASVHAFSLPDKECGEITYAEVASSFLDYLLAASRKVCGPGMIQIHVVFDRYFPSSPKQATRERRAKGSPGIRYHVTQEATVPKDWKLFLSNEENKTSLAKCITDYFLSTAKTKLKHNEQLYVSGGHENVCHLIVSDQCEEDICENECLELRSNHEEADTRIVCHAVHATRNGAQTLVINSPDTDVLVLLLHHRTAISAGQIFFATGRDGKHISLKRFVPVHVLHQLLSSSQMAVMLAIYCLTGCDTVSFFFGHGKARAFQLLRKNSEQFQALKFFGSKQSITKEEKSACCRFLCMLYGHSSDSLNDVRCKFAKSQKREIVGKKLPPTDDSFFLHVQRTLYQLIVWKQAQHPIMETPEPSEFGYETDAEDRLRPRMMTQGVSAPELLNDYLCECPVGECSDVSACICVMNAQPCTSACSCQAVMCELDESHMSCNNPFMITTESDSDTD